MQEDALFYYVVDILVKDDVGYGSQARVGLIDSFS